MTEVYIPNPVLLGFHPPTLVEEKQETVGVWGKCRKKHDHDGDWECERERLHVPDVPLKRIFADDLMRTLWLAAKARHLTSQYFRMDVVRVSRRIIGGLPLTEEKLSFLTAPLIGGGWTVLPPQRNAVFAAQLYPFVLGALQRMNRWPYIFPVEPQILRWKYVPKPYPEWPHAFQFPQCYSMEHKRQALERPEFSRCEVCKKPLTDPIHQLEGPAAPIGSTLTNSATEAIAVSQDKK